MTTEFTKTLNRQQLKQALRKIYSNSRDLKYAYQIVDLSVDKDTRNFHNVVPLQTRNGIFAFSYTYIGNKQFDCKSDFEELLRV